MRKLFIVLVAIAAVGLATIAPAGADETSVDYTCDETTATDAPDSLSATIPIEANDSVDPADIFETVTWTPEIELPDLAPPVTVELDYFRLEIPVPDGLRALSANVADPLPATANPPLNEISVDVAPDLITVQLPSSPAFFRRIRAANTGGLFYPSVFAGGGTPVVAPVVNVTAMPTFAAGGSTLEWRAPVVDTALTWVFPPNPTAEFTCTPDADPDPVIVSTEVTTDVNIPDNGYSDTPPNHFSDPGIDWGKHMGIIVANFTQNRFLPNDPVNRGQIVNMLWNMMDRPPPAGQHPFNDIPANAFYETALDWAFSAGLVTGFPGNKYKPKDPVNRQQLMQMLYQMVAAASGGPYPADDYTDGPTNAFFQPPMDWADELDLINEFTPNSPPGAEGTTVKPKQAAKRSEVAFILRRVAETDTWFVPLPSTVLHEPA
jgi:hypothetical protein